MLFIEIRYFIFFAAFFAVYWMLRSNVQRKWLMVVASYGFYAMWDWRWLGLLFLSTVVSHIVARGIFLSRNDVERRWWLVPSLVFHIGMLGVFKYFDFFSASFAALLTSLGVTADPIILDLMLPIGISFYTLHNVSYIADVYMRRIEARESFLDIAAFVAFFPQLVAGPILRARQFVPQLDSLRKFSDVPVRAALFLFLVGFVKKSVLADNIDPHVDAVFADPGAYTAWTVAGTSLLWSMQILLDFSGYSDMGTASAALLGYRFPQNFFAPHLAVSPADYRQRWHISLTTWLRDYLFVPLGGTKGGRWKTHRNIFIVNLVSGIWHGAAWTFVLWGIFNAIVISAQREIDQSGLKEKIPRALRIIFGFAVTLYTTAWVAYAFRADDIETVGHMLAMSHGLAPGGTQSLPVDPLLVFFSILVCQFVAIRFNITHRMEKMNWWLFAVLIGVAFALAFALRSPFAQPFYYFRF